MPQMHWEKEFETENNANSSKAVHDQLLQEVNPGKELWTASLIFHSPHSQVQPHYSIFTLTEPELKNDSIFHQSALTLFQAVSSDSRRAGAASRHCSSCSILQSYKQCSTQQEIQLSPARHWGAASTEG